LAKKEVAEDRAEVAVGTDGDGEEYRSRQKTGRLGGESAAMEKYDSKYSALRAAAASRQRQREAAARSSTASASGGNDGGPGPANDAHAARPPRRTAIPPLGGRAGRPPPGSSVRGRDDGAAIPGGPAGGAPSTAAASASPPGPDALEGGRPGEAPRRDPEQGFGRQGGQAEHAFVGRGSAPDYGRRELISSITLIRPAVPAAQPAATNTAGPQGPALGVIDGGGRGRVEGDPSLGRMAGNPSPGGEVISSADEQQKQQQTSAAALLDPRTPLTMMRSVQASISRDRSEIDGARRPLFQGDDGGGPGGADAEEGAAPRGSADARMNSPPSDEPQDYEDSSEAAEASRRAGEAVGVLGGEDDDGGKRLSP
ncbi:hypothetical protein THAOC_01858, partial [Thalassiosira oceanica]